MTESIYSQMGVSSQKEDVHEALKKTEIKELYPGSFCKILEDISRDPDYCTIQHQDGSGSKVLQSYIHYKESGEAGWFKGTVYDTIAMNLDDILCVGCTEPIIFTDTIDRNPEKVPGEVISVIINEFDKACENLRRLGVPIQFAGGETADLGDQVTTITVNGAATVRFPRDQVITGHDIAPGDVIIGISSTGKATYDEGLNSGIGSNGLTMARHTLMHPVYREKYPETVEPNKLRKKLAYFGEYKYNDYSDELGMT
ncbi:MAG: phosphoribosylformylglycinamidine cyclo-ligase, partial [Candidatus Diapherotrites archaeon]|nr:phosphoribosylformylglycinamidine cyclo-ligase [Candidatus Diapherotrites archaeon]